jgi:hypothetical protein
VLFIIVGVECNTGCLVVLRRASAVPLQVALLAAFMAGSGVDPVLVVVGLFVVVTLVFAKEKGFPLFLSFVHVVAWFAVCGFLPRLVPSRMFCELNRLDT